MPDDSKPKYAATCSWSWDEYEQDGRLVPPGDCNGATVAYVAVVHTGDDACWCRDVSDVACHPTDDSNHSGAPWTEYVTFCRSHHGDYLAMVEDKGSPDLPRSLQGTHVTVRPY